MNPKVPYAAKEGYLFYIYRILAIMALIFIFVPAFNPARISILINKSQSMLTSGISFKQLTSQFIRPVQKGWVQVGSLKILFYASLGGCLGIIAIGLGASLSLGELKLKRLSLWISTGGAFFSLVSTSFIYLAYKSLSQTSNPKKIQPQLPPGFLIILLICGVIFLLSLWILTRLPKPGAKDRF